jgi:hypothetical protein
MLSAGAEGATKLAEAALEWLPMIRDQLIPHLSRMPIHS